MDQAGRDQADSGQTGAANFRPVGGVRRRIGLSLGADLCWPICCEEVLRRLDLALSIGDDIVRFETHRVIIEPFDLGQPTSYDLVVGRLTHWYTISRERIKKAAGSGSRKPSSPTGCTCSTIPGRSSRWRSTRRTSP